MPAKYSLVRLEAQNNQLEFIDNKVLNGFEKLLSVDLSNNDLIEIHAGAWRKSPHLERLILSNNNLRTLWKETFIDQVKILIKVTPNSR